jgi:hypothetical protein
MSGWRWRSSAPPVPSRELAVATRPRATRPPETAARNVVARRVDSAIVDAGFPRWQAANHWEKACSRVHLALWSYYDSMTVMQRQVHYSQGERR